MHLTDKTVETLGKRLLEIAETGDPGPAVQAARLLLTFGDYHRVKPVSPSKISVDLVIRQVDSRDDLGDPADLDSPRPLGAEDLTEDEYRAKVEEWRNMME